jgi:hypothetical protein
MQLFLTLKGLSHELSLPTVVYLGKEMRKKLTDFCRQSGKCALFPFNGVKRYQFYSLPAMLPHLASGPTSAS